MTGCSACHPVPYVHCICRCSRSMACERLGIKRLRKISCSVTTPNSENGAVFVQTKLSSRPTHPLLFSFSPLESSVLIWHVHATRMMGQWVSGRGSPPDHTPSHMFIQGKFIKLEGADIGVHSHIRGNCAYHPTKYNVSAW